MAPLENCLPSKFPQAPLTDYNSAPQCTTSVVDNQCPDFVESASTITKWGLGCNVATLELCCLQAFTDMSSTCLSITKFYADNIESVYEEMGTIYYKLRLRIQYLGSRIS
jgi:hypothetical protein